MRLGIDASNIRAGGSLTHLSELLRAARPHEHGITEVIVWAGRGTLDRLPTRRWLRGSHEPLLDGSLSQRLYWQATKLSDLAKQSCDVLLIPGGNYKGAFRPFITMSRNLLPFQTAEMRRYGLSREFLRVLSLRFIQIGALRRADGVIFLNDYSHSIVMQQTRELSGRWAVIPHGLDRRFRLEPRVQKSISTYSQNEPFKLLYVSTIDVYKHQWHVAEAVAQLRREGLPVVLNLVGASYPPALRRLQKDLRHLDPHEDFIHYVGAVTHAELARYYHRANVFVFASSCENMPNILIEAMASGLPIGCSKHSPMPEILGTAGLYFDPEQPPEIADALRSLIEDPALRERNAWLAYERAQPYSWRRCATETFTFIAQIARDSKVLRLVKVEETEAGLG